MPTFKTNWIATDFYNYTDYERVENNTSIISALFNAFGYINSLTIITGRTTASLDFYDSLNRIEGNILTLRNFLPYDPPNWIDPFINWLYNMPFDYNTPNRWEIDLQALYLYIVDVTAELLYCGSPNSICGMGANYV